MKRGASSRIMASVSGLRGIIGESILPDLYIQYLLSYGSEIGEGTIIVGSDTRVSGDYLRYLVYSGLMATGCNIIDIGITPTPTIGMMVKEWGADGGIAISASHNPAPWNAVKFFSEKGTIISHSRFEKVLERVKKDNYILASYKELGSVQKKEDACRIHLDRVLQEVNTASISKKNFKVAADLCNGSACFIAPDLFQRMQCNTSYCYDKPTGFFEREPEPLSKNLTTLCALVKDSGADIGFAFDPDADRLAIIDEKGNCIGEERSTVLACYHVLKHKKRSPLVVNLSTTMAIEKVASLFSVPVYRTPIGEANVLTSMEKHQACLGGEGNGGVIYGPMHYGRDAVSGIALILELMSLENKPISEINAVVPSYPLKKEKISFSPHHFDRLIDNLSRHFSPDQINLTDGIKVTFSSGWVHLRPSGTEPIVRMYSEATDEKKLDEYRKNIYDLIPEI